MGVTVKFYIMFKNPFSFEGRIRRTEYGLSLIIAAVARVLVAMMVASVAQGSEAVIAYYIFVIPVLWFFWAQGAKRCHDLSMSGWFQIIPFFPLYLIFANGERDVRVLETGDTPSPYSRLGHGGRLGVYSLGSRHYCETRAMKLGEESWSNLQRATYSELESWLGSNVNEFLISKQYF